MYTAFFVYFYVSSVKYWQIFMYFSNTFVCLTKINYICTSSTVRSFLTVYLLINGLI